MLSHRYLTDRFLPDKAIDLVDGACARLRTEIDSMRAELEQVRREVEEAERAYDLNRAAELRYGKLTELERRLAAEEAQLAVKQGAHRLLREVVTEDEIARSCPRGPGSRSLA